MRHRAPSAPSLGCPRPTSLASVVTVDRIYVLLDLGISMTIPTWRWHTTADGRRIGGIDHERDVPATWYVDLVHIEEADDGLIVRDLYLDVMVPQDGRHARHLDLDELADAMADGTVPTDIALDGMRRWQRFLDVHLHAQRDPHDQWTDFPPSRLAPLRAEIPELISQPV